LKKRDARKIAKDLIVTIPPRAHTRIQRLVIVPLGLVVSLAFRFCGHNEPYESNHFLEQKRKMMTKTNTNINKQQNNKGEDAKGGWVLCFFNLVLWLVLFSYVFVKPRIFLNSN
jgi:hypothetical protein